MSSCPGAPCLPHRVSLFRCGSGAALPFLFWYSTWFGRKLSDSDLDAYFADRSKPRHAQRALVQVGERLSHGQSASRWYPQVIALANGSGLRVRQTAAWIVRTGP